MSRGVEVEPLAAGWRPADVVLEVLEELVDVLTERAKPSIGCA